MHMISWDSGQTDGDGDSNTDRKTERKTDRKKDRKKERTAATCTGSPGQRTDIWTKG